MSKTKGEYLQSLQASVNKVQKRKTPKGRIRTWGMAALVCVGSAAGIWYEANASASEQVSRYESYRDSTETIVSIDSLAYEDTFEIWNSRDIGNDANTLLSGGAVYVQGPIKVLPSSDFVSTNVILESGETQNIPMAGSSLNVVGNTIVFRNDATRNIHAYDLASGEDNIIFDGNAGEVFISDGRIYYIDLGDGFAVKSMNLDGSDKQKLLDGPIQSFAVFGDTIIYLDTEQSLFRTQPDGQVPQRLVSNIERFFIGEKVYAESKNTIIAFSPSGSEAEAVYVSESDDFRLIGYQEGKLFFQEAGALKYLEDGACSTVCSDNHVLYDSLDIDSLGKIYCIGFKDAGTKEVLVASSVPESGGSGDGE